MSKYLDDIVICVTVILSLVIALFLAYSLVERGANYPPTLTTIILGICVAALAYRFLGGTGGTEFSVGLLKLGGSVALRLPDWLCDSDEALFRQDYELWRGEHHQGPNHYNWRASIVI